ncbi:sulfatase [Stieleria sp. JC731]|uniref:sulfatase family protein n=1 Tax=Pirellulaceae TaxID=2691357 RepID=UPI001E394CBC|nr:sulfatase [Stieleria sp. JC731]MCC9602456.1 sulfatase [Stieleria sp. JC731]
MQRSHLIAFALVSLWANVAGTFRNATAAGRPNIILLYTDDQCFRSLGATGTPDVHTPNMDALATEGILFRRHYNSTSICMGSRASVMTGMYEYKTGCNFGHGPMRSETFQSSYPVLLRTAGYRTGFGGKFGFAVSDRANASEGSYNSLPVDQFDSWAGGTGQTNYQTAKNKYLAKYADRYPHSTRAYGAYADDFIAESQSDERPFCLTLFFKAPHRPFTPDPFFDDIYKDATFTLPGNYGREAGKHLAMQARLGRQSLTFFRDMGFDPARYQSTMRDYHQLIHGVDYAIGMIRQALQKHGAAENTIIILTSDNGFFCGSHGMGGKVLPYEEGSKVPLIIYDPRQSTNKPSNSGTTCDQLTATVDIAPTILELAGQPIPDQIDGVSLVPTFTTPVVQEPSLPQRDSVPLFQMWGAPTTFSMSVVTQTHKYIYWCCGEKMQPSEELFNLADDPMELVNVIDDPQEQQTLQTLRHRYQSQLAHLKSNAVAYNDYQVFGTLLDAAVPWESKSSLVNQKMWQQYESLAKQLGISPAQYFDFEKVLEASAKFSTR